MEDPVKQTVERMGDSADYVTDRLAIADLFLQANRIAEQNKFMRAQLERAAKVVEERNDKIKQLEDAITHLQLIIQNHKIEDGIS